jgi:sugar phosphate isomerase/epimerase
MSEMSRREFIRKTAADAAVASVLAAGFSATLRANPLGLPIGSQTYPHRQMIQDGKFVDLLKQLKSIGVDQIELCGFLGGTGYPEFKALSDGAQTKKIIEDNGLKAVSAHFIFVELRDNLAKAIDWSKALGLQQMMIPTLGGPTGQNGQPAPTLDDVKRLTDQFNKMAVDINKAGMRAGSHNEAFDLTMINGKRTYDMVIENTDPKLIGFQFQMSTITTGLVAAEYFAKYPTRFFSMHIQDIDMKTTTPAANGRGPGHPQTPVGKGSIDWAATFAAARKAGGIKNYFVEQNMDLTKESVAALRAMKA